MNSPEHLQDEFPLRPGLAYLNHAAVSPWPKRAARAVQAFADENAHQGSLAYGRWLEVEARLRRRAQMLINAPAADDIALVKNTSEGLSLVAWGLDWRPGDRVVITDQEFPSNRIVWESLAPLGVEIREAVLTAEDPEGAILNQMDDRTRLLAVSAVQYGTGLRLDLERLGRECQSRGVLFCVDAIQAVGAIPMDVQSQNVDFLAADGHKWMLGPEGLGIFYCREALRERLRLSQYGWHMVEHMGDYARLDWKPASSARRFECGSPNMLGIHALEASLSLFEEFGMPAVASALQGRIDYLVDALLAIPDIELLSPLARDRRAGIVTFRHSSVGSDALHRVLQDQGVLCACRTGGIRLSPHFYTPPAALELAVKTVREACLKAGELI